MNQFVRKHIYAIASGVVAIVFIVTAAIVLSLGADKASKIGDAFGLAAALLSGVALFGFAISVHDLSENQVQQQKQLDALAAIARAITDPVIIARVDVRDNTDYHLFIENMGKSPAYNIRFEVEPNTGGYPNEFTQWNLADLDFIKHGLPVMAPGQKVSAWIANGSYRSEKKKEGVEQLEEFSITITYDCRSPRSTESVGDPDRRTYYYAFSFNREGAIQPRSGVAHELYRLREVIATATKK